MSRTNQAISFSLCCLFVHVLLVIFVVVIEALNGGTTAGKDNRSSGVAEGCTGERGLEASCTGWSPPRSQHLECISGQRARSSCPRSAPAPGPLWQRQPSVDASAYSWVSSYSSSSFTPWLIFSYYKLFLLFVVYKSSCCCCLKVSVSHN